MLEVTEEIKNLYKSDTFNGNVSFTIDSTTYTASNILASSTVITESISSGKDVDFRSVEKSCLETTLINIVENIKELKGKTLTMKQTVLNTDIPLGVYTIIDAVNDGDYLYEITAYDNLYKFDVDVSDWWNNEVTFPISLRDLLISLCTKVGVSYNFPTTFTNSTFSVQKNTYVEGTTGAEFLGYIQEVCASFIRPDRTGVMKMIQIGYVGDGVLCPSTTLYPSDVLYPDSVSEGGIQLEEPSAEYNVPVTMEKLQIADYTVRRITRVQVRGTSDDVGIIVGGGANTYVIEANPLLYSLSGTEDDIALVTAILDDLNKLSYTPVHTAVKVLPYVEVGDLISFVSYEGKEVFAPLLNRTMSGFLLNKDTIDIKGSEVRETISVPANKNIRILNQRLHEYVNSLTELRSTLREVNSEITDLDTRVTTNESELLQLPDSITLQIIEQVASAFEEDEFLTNAKLTFTFDLDGLTIAREDAEYQTVITNEGLRVVSAEDGTPSLISERDSVTAENLTANQYLRVQSEQVSSRFQQFYSSVHGENEFGVFWEV